MAASKQTSKPELPAEEERREDVRTSEPQAELAGADNEGLIAVISADVSRDPLTGKVTEAKTGAWEKDLRHPGGEVFVAGEAMFVAPTPYIMDRLNKGFIVQVEPAGVEPAHERVKRERMVREAQQLTIDAREHAAQRRYLAEGERLSEERKAAFEQIRGADGTPHVEPPKPIEKTPAQEQTEPQPHAATTGTVQS